VTFSGQNLREVLAEARRLGCAVTPNAAGEWAVSHPTWPRRVRVSGHRRDAPRSLTSLLIRLQKARQRA
jgi:hypothetical protein